MEIYLAAFETPVRNRSRGQSCPHYNNKWGVFLPKQLLTTVLREMWGFEGFVVTDWGGMDRRPGRSSSRNELEMPGFEGSDGKEIVEAVKNGTLDEEKLDRAITRYLNILFRWEENKRPGTVYDSTPLSRTQRCRRDDGAAKNEGNVLPFGKGDYLVIGDYAMNMPYQGGGSSHINSTKVDNLVEELEKITGSKVAYEKGYHSNGQMDEALFSSAVSAAEKADNVVIVLGQGSEFYTEGMDRPHMKLDDNQTKLVEAVLDANQNTAVVLVCGSSVELPWVDKAKVILVAYLGGQAAGGAVADILTGAVNPSAKFAETWPERIEHNPSYLSFPGDDEVVYSEGIFWDTATTTRKA